jgi:hypothetical protein
MKKQRGQASKLGVKENGSAINPKAHATVTPNHSFKRTCLRQAA